jgi:transposase
MSSAGLPDDLQTLKAMLLAERCESERLRQIMKELQRHRFGRRAETLPEEQMLLGLEEVEQVEASGEAKQDENAPDSRAARVGKRRINRGALPAHLPRIEIVVDIDDKTCPCCKGELHRIGEDKSERLDIVPAQFRVLVTRRPKYACRTCEDGVVQAPAPARLIEGGLPTEATVAQVLVSKYADRPSAAVPASPNLRPPGYRSGSFHAGGLGWPRRLASASAARAPSHEAQELRQIVRG